MSILRERKAEKVDFEQAFTNLSKRINVLEMRLAAAEQVAHEAHIFLNDFLHKRTCVPGALDRVLKAWYRVLVSIETGP